MIDGLDFLSEFEAQLAEWLTAQAELSAVRTVESDLREVLLSGQELTEGYADEELPAIHVVAGLEDTVSSPQTMTQARLVVPVSFLVVAIGDTRTDARGRCRAIQDGLELVLNRLRTSRNPLGHQTVLTGEIRTSCGTEKSGVRYYGVGELKTTIQRVREMSL